MIKSNDNNQEYSTCYFRFLKRNVCLNPPNEATCIFKYKDEPQCGGYLFMKCTICEVILRGMVNEFRNPIDGILTCETCYQKQIQKYIKITKKKDLTKKDLTKKDFEIIFLNIGKKIFKKTRLDQWM